MKKEKEKLPEMKNQLQRIYCILHFTLTNQIVAKVQVD